jgi:hypothetical protein
VLPHPPHSPDLGPSDYHLFGVLKDYVRGQHYENDNTAKEAVCSYLGGGATDLFCSGIFKLICAVTDA